VELIDAEAELTFGCWVLAAEADMPIAEAALIVFFC